MPPKLAAPLPMTPTLAARFQPSHVGTRSLSAPKRIKPGRQFHFRWPRHGAPPSPETNRSTTPPTRPERPTTEHHPVGRHPGRPRPRGRRIMGSRDQRHRVHRSNSRRRASASRRNGGRPKRVDTLHTHFTEFFARQPTAPRRMACLPLRLATLLILSIIAGRAGHGLSGTALGLDRGRNEIVGESRQSQTAFRRVLRRLVTACQFRQNGVLPGRVLITARFHGNCQAVPDQRAAFQCAGRGPGVASQAHAPVGRLEEIGVGRQKIPLHTQREVRVDRKRAREPFGPDIKLSLRDLLAIRQQRGQGVRIDFDPTDTIRYGVPAATVVAARGQDQSGRA